MKEEYKTLPIFGGKYSISNLGNVRLNPYTLHTKTGLRRIQGKVLKTSLVGNGYEYIVLQQDNVRRGYLVHRLVAQNFIWNAERKPCVNHIDGNKLNNKVSNLEWCTYQENLEHKTLNLLSTKSGIPGIVWNERRQKWVVRYTANGIREYLGGYDTIEEAVTVLEQFKGELL